MKIKLPKMEWNQPTLWDEETVEKIRPYDYANPPSSIVVLTADEAEQRRRELGQ